MARRIVIAVLVDWIDKAGTEKVRPQPIHGGTSEKWILGADNPVGEDGTRIIVALPTRFDAIEEASADGFFLAGDGNLLLGFAVPRITVGKKSGERPELLLRPRSPRPILVTLSALQLNAQKKPRRV